MLSQKGATRAMNLEIVRQIATLEDGWATALQVAWDVGGDDSNARRDVRIAITALVRDGVLDRIWARHRDQQLEIVLISRDALLAALNALSA